MSRETVTGVLHASVVSKVRGLLDQVVLRAAIDAGTVTYDDRRFFYAPRYYLSDHDHETIYARGKPLRLLSFKGQPKALSVGLRGHAVTVRATIEAWDNGIGAHLLRPEILDVSDELVSDHECDSPNACGVNR